MNRNSLSCLDSLRLRLDPERLRYEFRILAFRDRSRASRLINDANLQFPTLFILTPEIEAMRLTQLLNDRGREAVALCTAKDKKSRWKPRKGSPTEFDALKWMFETGYNWDGPLEQYDSYDAVIDTCAAVLIKSYKYTAILPSVCDLIFRRNRLGLYIHDLVWSFFEARDPDSLMLIAKYLLSPDARDFELARRLLHLPDFTGDPLYSTGQKLYDNFISWLGKNSPYLLFTGQYFQQTSEPEPLTVDDEALYLGKKISPKSGKPLEPLTQEETRALLEYRRIPDEERRLLSSYSAKTRDRDPRMWRQWLHGDLVQQVSVAKSESEAV